MKALSIRQPWAWLIVKGHKDIENRTWSTRFRGRVLIHAGARLWCLGTTKDGSLCAAIGVAPALRQVPPSSTHGREACAQGIAGQDRSTRRSTKGRPVIHRMCFASSSNRMNYIDKACSGLSALWAYQKHPTRST
ncbi:ASCH domain-containing protein [Paraburkholderia aromaticivorans]|uniref:ASCH domain-containing protein n=1 Tax=Paraburkholderia aromaticivorans TaxID=2026199 RepID=UPI00197F8674|nr:ASCH domain-containing protein [Paraburkholderia aromaticivorans]